jgi:hypothetical protein
MTRSYRTSDTPDSEQTRHTVRHWECTVYCMCYLEMAVSIHILVPTARWGVLNHVAKADHLYEGLRELPFGVNCGAVYLMRLGLQVTSDW